MFIKWNHLQQLKMNEVKPYINMNKSQNRDVEQKKYRIVCRAWTIYMKFETILCILYRCKHALVVYENMLENSKYQLSDTVILGMQWERNHIRKGGKSRDKQYLYILLLKKYLEQMWPHTQKRKADGWIHR